MDIDKKVEELLQQMTLREKVSLLSGKDAWHSMSIERLGIPSLIMTDGPHGVRSTHPETGRIAGPTTSFPTGVSMASTWNPELIERVGAALGEETLGMGCDILLGPCVNIVRTPLAGRNFESYSEDPFLAGKIGIAFVKGVQSKGVGASLKHYACNNQEIERGRGSSEVDERTMREIYLTQFEAIVKEAKPWTVMCSYNRINGIYASENYHLLTDILRDEWGFEGVVISDWGANHTIVESVEAGLDIEMPGPAKYYGGLLVEAVNNWQIESETIDISVRRILKMVLSSGRISGTSNVQKGAINTPEHQSLAREVAEEAIVLLKNDNRILPLDRSKILKIAVIGPNAIDPPVSGGGSAKLDPPYHVNILEGMQKTFGPDVDISYEQGCDNYVELPLLKGAALQPSHESKNGFWAEYYSTLDFSGSPVISRLDEKIAFWLWGTGIDDRFVKEFSARWTAQFNIQKSGPYTFGLQNTAHSRLFLDDQMIIENDAEKTPGEPSVGKKEYLMNLEAGRNYTIKVEYIRPARIIFSHLKVMCAYTPQPKDDDRITKALTLARTCDAVIFVGGLPEGYETEGWDRPDMELTGNQNELISQLANANKNLVVVLYAGAPVTMPWIDDVPAVILAYYPGMEGGNALAKIISGDVNPSGKLPISIPKRLEDNPTYINYPGGREVYYGEGIYIGYRYFDEKNIDPLFPFGFGLSYTNFQYSDLSIPKSVKKGESFAASVKIKNTGGVPGKEVVQLYIQDEESSLARPLKELKGFQKVYLKPGEEKTVRFKITERDLSFFDDHKMMWMAEPGYFTIHVGSSSKKIILSDELFLKLY